MFAGDDPLDWAFLVKFNSSMRGKLVDVEITSKTFTASPFHILQGLLSTANDFLKTKEFYKFEEFRSPLHVAWEQASSAYKCFSTLPRFSFARATQGRRILSGDMPIRLTLLINALCAIRLVLNLRFYKKLLEQFSEGHLEITNMRLSAFSAALYAFVLLKGRHPSISGLHRTLESFFHGGGTFACSRNLPLQTSSCSA